jgi:hypothetical protein
LLGAVGGAALSRFSAELAPWKSWIARLIAPPLDAPPSEASTAFLY